jgi:PH (Pleckstrin Homology) domain-containing protein
MPQVYHIAAANLSRAWLYVPIVFTVVLLAGVAWLLVASYSGSRKATFELSADGLRLRGDVYGRFIPISELELAQASRVDVTTGRYKPTARTAGTAVPGYRSGWFRLADGSNALLYLTDPSQAVRVPTTDGYSVLLSVTEADQFVEAMHRLAPPAAP